MSVITRFAPSPTGFLHIGGARTALFNWLFAKHHGGEMLLRIEDTDRARSTEAAVTAIHEGLHWLGLDWRGEPISQFARADRHAEVARQLLADGNAYYCYATPEALSEMRETAKAEGRSMRYDGRWRGRDPSEAPAGASPVIRLKAPQDGATVIQDLVQGEVTVQNTEMDDMVLLRADGTPTYMLAVVVDDHDMDVSHVIRGDDHLTNALRQRQIYDLMGWSAPHFAHIPLIHGADGAKLSKRHGALGVEAYRDMGILPAALRNYLLRLGWSHGDEEIIDTAQAIAWFDLEGVGKSAARFDIPRLESLNSHYIRTMDEAELCKLLAAQLCQGQARELSAVEAARLPLALDALKERAKTLIELADKAGFLLDGRPLALEEKAAKLLEGEAPAILARAHACLGAVEDWNLEPLTEAIRGLAEAEDLKLGKLAQPLRAALTGRNASPGIFEVLYFLGRQESLDRIGDHMA
ncbi:MAG: glutamate--tRNA ligase [Rhodospirillaceae bacterium]|jgi:glutamyl-tRNA synthetase|nr:glutamate--tRNA ligase [Rhodospirillaceae bacterium]MBT3492544.1 glutamate--tRNA ligase [Rhodospirillaceae bacterium]MBT3782413.1 glutamate--tRNA ligase [Rhodospirillaceae bacterium]MBT3979004.1 glutamate--tRNA ligase [Rhodospirillaceae bacterium]MBT4169321.1 glutamate--tRNA ligase [Rhodospirillaceae bacterium]